MMAWTGWYMATAWDFLFGLNRAVWNGLRWLYLQYVRGQTKDTKDESSSG